MNIVQIMPQYPFPMTDGGKVGLGSIALELAAQGHRLIVLCYASPGTVPMHPEHLDLRMVEHSTANTPSRIARSVVQHRALYLSKHDHPAMEAAVRAAVNEIDADVILADHTCMGPIASRVASEASIPWALRLHNVEWMIWQRYAERYPWWHPARWYVRGQAIRVRREEADILGQASVVFAITPTDAERALAMQPQARIVVAPAGVHAEQWDRPRLPATPPQVIMASNFRWVHNADALRWFLDTVWPTVRGRTSATLHIVGTALPRWIADTPADGVVAEGFVEDLAERYRTATLSIAPLFVGSGMRIKIIEAMAAGLPVVATSISAEGIELFDQDGLFRHDDANAMAACIIGLLEDRHLCSTVGQQARASVAERYTWRQTVDRMIERLDDVTKSYLTRPTGHTQNHSTWNVS